jgi:hypothetical protein
MISTRLSRVQNAYGDALKSAEFLGLTPQRLLACAVVGVVSFISLDLACAQSTESPAAVRVYDATELAMGRYSVIKRLWVESWQSAFEIRTHATAAAGTKALIDAAAALGADGVVDLTCIPSSSSLLSKPGYRCYGNAIRLKAR